MAAFLIAITNIFSFFLVPFITLAAGGALGYELANRDARRAPERADRGWRRIHQFGATFAALYVMLMLTASTSAPSRTSRYMQRWRGCRCRS